MDGILLGFPDHIDDWNRSGLRSRSWHCALRSQTVRGPSWDFPSAGFGPPKPAGMGVTARIWLDFGHELTAQIFLVLMESWAPVLAPCAVGSTWGCRIEAESAAGWQEPHAENLRFRHCEAHDLRWTARGPRRKTCKFHEFHGEALGWRPVLTSGGPAGPWCEKSCSEAASVRGVPLLPGTRTDPWRVDLRDEDRTVERGRCEQWASGPTTFCQMWMKGTLQHTI